jgi:hypothetical protein
VGRRDRGPEARLLPVESAAEAVLEAPSAVQLLDSAAALVVAALPSCSFAAVVAPGAGRLMAIAGSNPKALQFERLQMEIGEGPSVDAATTGQTFSVADLSGEARWSEFVPRALAADVRSVLSMPTARDGGAVLSLYSDEPAALGPGARDLAEPFVAHVRLVLGTFQMHDRDTAIVEQLRVGLESRTVIGQAQGILMERERVTPEEAFAILRTASQHMNVKLREIAARVVETGEDPRKFRADT